MKRALALLPIVIVGCSPANGPWERAAAALPNELAQAKQIGMPLELGDIGLPMNLPAGQNAAPFYREAIAKWMKVPGRNDLEKRLGTASLAPRITPAIKSELGKLDPIVALTIQAAGKAKCDFGRDWAKGFDVMFPELAQLKSLVKVTSMDAVLDAKEGRFDSSATKLRACFKVAEHAGSEPIIIGTLVQIALDAITYRRFEQVISMAASNPGALQRLEGALEGLAAPSMAHGLKGEIVLGRISLQHLKTPNEMANRFTDSEEESAQPTAGVPKSIHSAPVEHFAKANEARLIEFWRKAWPTIERGDPVAIGAKLDELIQQVEGQSDPTYTVVAILMPVFSQAGQSVVRDACIRQLIRTKIDILQFRAQEGRYPKTLDEIRPGLVDPISKSPFVYKPTATGFVLYAFGQNGKDDGGRRRGTTGDQNFDEVVEHPFDTSKIAPR